MVRSKRSLCVILRTCHSGALKCSDRAIESGEVEGSNEVYYE